MRRKSRAQGKSIDEENPYWMSFSDVMAGLLVLFILASAALLVQLMEKSKKINETIVEAQQTRKVFLQDLQKNLQEVGVYVEVVENYTVLRIPEKQLSFASGSSEIAPEHKENLKHIGQAINNLLSNNKKNQEFFDTIFVEGHTDTVPFQHYRGFSDGNWPLSAERAIQVWEFWNLPDVTNESLKNKTNYRGAPLFSVSGYAGSRPAFSVEGHPENSSKNRRIDIRVTIRHISETDLEDIGGIVQ